MKAKHRVQSNAWFIRSNGSTLHNEPGTPLYIPGEPPTFPKRDFNHVEKCLAGGFIRIGWPAAGDLRQPGWRMRALTAYGASAQPHQLAYLEKFASIEPGDIILTPAGPEKFVVYLGRVVGPYYYHFDIRSSDWFENAHRIPVEWCRARHGDWATAYIAGIGGPWLHAFSRIGRGKKAVMDAFRDITLRPRKRARRKHRNPQAVQRKGGGG